MQILPVALSILSISVQAIRIKDLGISKQELLVRRRRNIQARRQKRRAEWTGLEHQDLPNWEVLQNSLEKDPHWQAHVAASGDIHADGNARDDQLTRSGLASDLSTDNSTSQGLLGLRKFRQLKTMILYLQQNPEFGKYCYYGCWCFIDGSNNMDTGFGEPRDNIDTACRAFSKCYRCLEMDYTNFEETERYNFAMDEVNGVKEVTCNDPSGTMKRNLCECDRELAYRLAEHESEWDKQYSERGFGGDFDRRKECFTPLNQKYEVDQCCGSYPGRYPFSSRQGIRECCNDKIYSSEYSQCCSGDTIKPNDETC